MSKSEPSAALTVVHEVAARRFALYRQDGPEGAEALGELTYSQAGEGVVATPRTWVDDSLRGQGAAGRLFDAMVQWARRDGVRIRPECSYVASRFERDPSLGDILAK